MAMLDRLIGKLTPPESEEDRAEATRKARAAAQPGDWLSLALDHHDDIRAGFAEARAAGTGPERLEAVRRLGEVLNGHALAEEVVLYPAMAQAHEKAHAMQAYTEQTAAKMQMAELETLDPLSKDWDDKLAHIEGAVLHHIYEEESGWFLKLKDADVDQAHLTARYSEEYGRYMHGPDDARDGPGAMLAERGEGSGLEHRTL